MPEAAKDLVLPYQY